MLDNVYKYQDGRVVTLLITDEVLKMNAIKFGLGALAMLSVLATNVCYAGLESPSRMFRFDAPGIGSPSWPMFMDQNGTIEITKNGSGANTYWTLTGTGDSTSFLGSFKNKYEIGDSTVKYVANFNARGELITSIGNVTNLTNYLTINGSLGAGKIGNTSWDTVDNQLLLQANLVSVNTWKNKAIGFKTMFTGGWAVDPAKGFTGGSIGENLWLTSLSKGFRDLVRALDSDRRNHRFSSVFKNDTTIRGVNAIASVPIPGAVWLFGSAMMMVLANQRKNLSPKLAA